MVSAAASPGGSARPVLVAAKLHVPALQAGMVYRGELVGRHACLEAARAAQARGT